MCSFSKIASGALLPLSLILSGCLADAADEGADVTAEVIDEAALSDSAVVSPTDPTLPCGPGTLIQSLACQGQVQAPTYYPNGFAPGYYGSAYGHGSWPGYSGYWASSSGYHPSFSGYGGNGGYGYGGAYDGPSSDGSYSGLPGAPGSPGGPGSVGAPGTIGPDCTCVPTP